MPGGQAKRNFTLYSTWAKIKIKDFLRSHSISKNTHINEILSNVPKKVKRHTVLVSTIILHL